MNYWERFSAALADAAAYVKKRYGFNVDVVSTRTNLYLYPDPNTGLFYYDMFFVVAHSLIPAGGIVDERAYVAGHFGDPTYGLDTPEKLGEHLVTLLAAAYDIPRPRQLEIVVLPPPPPTVLVGPRIEGTTNRFYPVVGDVSPEGTIYTAPDGTRYVKIGHAIFGIKSFEWVQLAA
jgi:hypothetical protein